MLITATQTTDIELDTITNVVTWVFNRVTGFITLCNEHHSLYIPIGFAIAAMTVRLFKSALNVPSNNNY